MMMMIKLRWKPAWFQHTMEHHSQLLPVKTAEISCYPWSNTRPMAERQVFMLGRDGHMSSGRIILHMVRVRGR